MKLILLLLLPSAAAWAQVSAPKLGCFRQGEGAVEIMGVSGNFLTRSIAAELCLPVESAWSLAESDGDVWLERRDPASGAMEHRERLGPGCFGVFTDGQVINFAALGLPGAIRGWQPAGRDWIVAFTESAAILLNPQGQWFFLPQTPGAVEPVP